MCDSLTRLYLQRLDSFTQTLNYLHEIVGADEALTLLKDERLVQYKIDRVGELVRQVITSEKERIIIQLIHKIDLMERQAGVKEIKKQEVDQSQLIYYRKRLEQKNEEIQKNRNECSLLRQQRDQHKKVSQQLKLQFQIYQNKYKEIKQKWQKFENMRDFQVKTDKQKSNELIQRATILGVQLQKEKTKNQQSLLSKDNTISILKQEIQTLTAKLHQNKLPSYKQKSEKIEWLKKEVKRLGNQLNEMKQMTKIILNYIRQSLSAQLKGIKNDISSINSYISSQFKMLLRDQANLFKEYKINMDKNTAQVKDQQLLKRMQGLQEQLNGFMETNKI